MDSFGENGRATVIQPALRWLRYTMPAVAWAALIWALSTESFSSAQTSRVIPPLLQWLFPHASEGTILVLHEAIRKTAHLAEYFVFSWLILHAIRSGRREWRLRWALGALGIAVAYAGVDELHQAWVLDRGSSVGDVLLDAVGAGLAQVALWQMRPQR